MTPRKVHSFRADHDVEEILGGLDKYTKSLYINKAIRDHQKIEEVKSILKKHGEERPIGFMVKGYIEIENALGVKYKWDGKILEDEPQIDTKDE